MNRRTIVLLVVVLIVLIGGAFVLISRSSRSAPPVISEILPAAGPISTKVTVVGNGFASKNDVALRNSNAVGGDQTYTTGYINNVSSSDGKTLSFELPEEVGVCPAIIKPNEACPAIALLLNEGDYEIFVVNQNGESNKKIFKITPTP